MPSFHDLDAVDRRYQVRVAKLGNVTIKVPSPFVQSSFTVSLYVDFGGPTRTDK